MPPVLNMPGLDIWQGGEYARVTQGAEYALISLKGGVRYIFASLLLGLNESTCQMKKNVFFISLQNLFWLLRKSNFRILCFQIS